MFGNLQNAASVFSDDISSTFMKAMESLPNAIRESTDPSIGMFSTSMDKMVQEAKRTFGIGVTSASSESILGAAYFLAKGMPGAFRQAFDSGIVSQFVTPFSTKVKNELNNTVPANLWVKSAGVAMVEMVNEMKRKLVSLKGTLYDDFKKLFSEMPVTDLSRIFGDMFKDLDSEALKDYFANLFPTAEELKAKIITIETVRSKDGSGGGEAPKASPGFTPSELGPTDVDYSKYKDYVERMAELREKAAEPAQSEKQDPKQSFFGKFKDIIVGIADYLGPVKTAILGALGVVAGAGAAIPIWTGIKVAAVAIGTAVGGLPILIGTVIGVLIYLYARFKSVRDIVNGIAMEIRDGLVAAFNFLKDIGVKAFDEIKIAFSKLWDGFTGVALPKIGEIWNGFTIGFTIAFDWLKEQIGRRVSVLIDIIKALIDPLKDYWEAAFKASFNLIKSFFENVSNIIVELFATLKVIFEPIIKIIVGVFIIITEAITILWEKLKTPIITIATFIIKTFTFLLPIFSSIGSFIFDVIGGAIVGLLKIIKFVFEGVYKSVGTVVNVAVGIAKAIFNVLNAIWTNPVVKWIRDFLFRVLMLGIFIVASLLEAFAKTIFNAFKTVFNIFKNIATFIYNTLKPGLELIGNVVKFVFTPVISIIKVVIDIVKFLYGEFGFLGLALTPFVAVLELIRRIFMIVWNVVKSVFKGIYSLIESAIVIIKIVASAIWDGLGKVWGLISPIVNAFWDGITTAAGFVWDLLKTMGSSILDVLGSVWDVIGSVATKFWDGIKIAAQTVWDFLKTVGTGIWNAIGWVWDMIAAASQKFWDLIAAGWELVGPIFEQLWEWLWNGINYAWDTLKQTLQFYWDLFKEMWGWVEPVLSQLWEWLWNGIKWAWDQLVEVVQFYWDLFKQMWGWIEPVLSQLWDWLWTGIKFAWDKITDAVQFMWEGVKVMWSWIQPVLNTLWDLLWNGIKLAWDGITTAVQFVWDKIKAMWDAVYPILKTMWEWIKDKIGAAVDGVKGAWNGLKDAVSNTFNWFKDKFSSIGGFIREGIGGAVDWVSDKLGNIPNLFKGALNAIIRGVNNVTGFSFTMPDWLKYVPGLGGVAGKTYSFRDVIPELPQVKYNGGKIGSYMKGGMAYGSYMKGGMAYGYGGMTAGFAQQAVPAILHGGEYIINHKAAQRIGTDTLDALNNLRLSKPRYPRMPSIPGISMPNVRIDNSTQVPVGSSTSNVNIYVDNFIGEPEWFNSMMKDYNMKVAPRNQKAAGLENRVITTYNGLNRGM
jgi:phage-related protein